MKLMDKKTYIRIGKQISLLEKLTGQEFSISGLPNGNKLLQIHDEYGFRHQLLVSENFNLLTESMDGLIMNVIKDMDWNKKR